MGVDGGGRAPSPQTAGTVELFRGDDAVTHVSPDVKNISVADRTIGVRVTDPDLNIPTIVGDGGDVSAVIVRVNAGGSAALEQAFSIEIATLTTDEDIIGDPNLRVFLGDPAVDAGIAIPDPQRGANTWTYGFEFGAGDGGQYSLEATAVDDIRKPRNVGTRGTRNSNDDGAITFQVDRILPEPVPTQPSTGSSVGFNNPFVIEVDWSSESGEYTNDSYDVVNLTKLVLDEGKGNDLDLLSEAITTDGAVWMASIGNIRLGAHTLTLNGQDSAGNTLLEDYVVSFMVDPANVLGRVVLQGRNSYGGMLISFVVDGSGTSYIPQSSVDGSYVISPPTGIYTVTIDRDGFLAATRENVQVIESQILELPSVQLLAGDVDNNGRMDAADLVLPGINLGGTSSPWD